MMIYQLAFEILVKSTIVLVAAMLVYLLCGRRWPLLGSSIWNAAIVVLLLLPVASFAPPVAIDFAADEVKSVAVTYGTPVNPKDDFNTLSASSNNRREITGASDVELPTKETTDTAASSATEVARAAIQPIDVRWWIRVAYLIGAGFVLIRLLASMGQLRAQRRCSAGVEDTYWIESFEKWQTELQLANVQLLQSANTRVPFACGVRAPAVIVPDYLVQNATPGEADAILLHELTHIARRDCAWLFALKAVQVLYWFNPLVWLAGRTMNDAREAICDRFCLWLLDSREQYADCLLRVASNLSDSGTRSANSTSMAIEAAMVRSPKLEVRLKQLEIGSLQRNLPGIQIRVAMLLLAIVGGVFFGAGVVDAIANPQNAAGMDILGDPLPPGAVARLGTNRLRHGEAITNIQYAQDGKTIVSWTNRIFHLWDADTGRLIRRETFGLTETLRWVEGFPLLLRVNDDTLAVASSAYEFGKGQLPMKMWKFTDLQTPAPNWKSKNLEINIGDRRLFRVSPVDGAFVDGFGDVRTEFVGTPDGKWMASSRANRNSTESIIDFHQIPADDVIEDASNSVVVSGVVQWMKYSADGQRLAVLSAIADGQDKDSSDRPWDPQAKDTRHLTIVSTGDAAILSELEIPQPRQNQNLSIDFSPGGKLIAVHNQRQVHVIDTGAKTQVASFDLGDSQHPESSQLSFSPDGKLLAAGGDNGHLQAWDLATKKRLYRVEASHSWIECMTFSPDSKRVVSGGQDNMLRIWDAMTGKEQLAQTAHEYRPFGATISADGKTAATSSADGTARVWDAETGQLQHLIYSQPSTSKHMKRTWVPAVHLTKDANTILVVETNRVSAFNLSSKPAKELWHWDDAGKQVSSISSSLSVDETRFAVGIGNVVSVLDVATGKVIQRFDSARVDTEGGDADDKLEIETACLSFNGKLLAVSSNSSMAASAVIEVWDVDTKKRLLKIVPEKANPNHITFSSDGSKILTAGHSMTRGFVGVLGDRSIGSPQLEDSLIVWDVDSGEVVRKFGLQKVRTERRDVSVAAYSADGQHIFSAEEDGRILIYEVATGKQIRTLQGHFGDVKNLACSADGRRLVSVGDDLTGLVWDVDGISQDRKE